MTAPGIPPSLNIKEYGNYRYTRRTAWYLANVPLNMIRFESWEPSRYVRNKELIETTGTTLPIILGSIEDSKYTLIDGNHRCFCCNELGYTHIPAIIHVSIKNDAFVKIPF
jgi:ParB-like nuclease domain